jgi:hypothetical protein
VPGRPAHRALIRLRDTRPIVALTRALAARWPAGRTLEFVHAPLDPGFYAALAGLRLPPGVRFAAGVLHEDRTPDELRRVLGIVEDTMGSPVDLAAACGLGRRSREAARYVLRQAADLCASDTTLGGVRPAS